MFEDVDYPSASIGAEPTSYTSESKMAMRSKEGRVGVQAGDIP